MNQIAIAAQRQQLRSRVKNLIFRVSYRDGYEFVLETDKTDSYGRLYLQLQVQRPDVFTGEIGTGYSGKAYLSEHMTDSEISRVLIGLCLGYEEHEVREFFKIDEVAVYGPHIALDALITAGKELDFRQPVEAAEETTEAPKPTVLTTYEEYVAAPVGRSVYSKAPDGRITVYTKEDSGRWFDNDRWRTDNEDMKATSREVIE